MSSYTSIFDEYQVIGAPTHMFLYPRIQQQKLYNKTTVEILKQFYEVTEIINHYYEKEESEDVANREKFGADVPVTRSLQNNVNNFLLNVHPYWEGNRPVPLGAVYMGGIPERPHQEISEDLIDFLNYSKHGVIYISFGTNVNTAALPLDKVHIMIKVLSKLPYDVLWKWDSDDLPGRTRNIKIMQWFPQPSMLKHPKIKLFITQGGIQSTYEAMVAMVPMIGVPILGDQWYNVQKIAHHGIGVQIELHDIEENLLKDTITDVIGDKRYRNNIRRLVSIIQDQPVPPLERAVWWTEHVLRHGGARHLRAPAANMPWTQYYELDLALLVLSIALAAIVLGSLAIYKLVKFVISQVLNSMKRTEISSTSKIK